MRITARGGLPNSTIDAISPGRRDALAADAQCLVDPGHEKDQLQQPRSLTMLRKLSMRLLPDRSGISNSLGPATWTKPGLPPRGEASTLASEPEVAGAQNGDMLDEFLRMGIEFPGRAFATTRGDGFG